MPLYYIVVKQYRMPLYYVVVKPCHYIMLWLNHAIQLRALRPRPPQHMRGFLTPPKTQGGVCFIPSCPTFCGLQTSKTMIPFTHDNTQQSAHNYARGGQNEQGQKQTHEFA